MASLIAALALLTLWIASVSIDVAGDYLRVYLIAPTLVFLFPSVWIMRTRVRVSDLPTRLLPGALVTGGLAGSAIATSFMPGAGAYSAAATLVLLAAAAAGGAITVRIATRAPGSQLRPGAGARAGAMTALAGIPIALGIAIVMTAGIRATARERVADAMRDMSARAAGYSPDAQAAFETAAARATSVSGYVLNVFVATLFLFGPLLAAGGAAAGAWRAGRSPAASRLTAHGEERI